jgi:rhodanese-related sulfurtransferase
MRSKTWLALLLWALLPAALASGAAPALKLVDPATLKGMLGDPQLVIIDVRVPASWAKSDRKIQGAMRQDPNQVAVWGPKLPRHKKFVLY